MDLERVATRRMNGEEKFHRSHESLGISVLEYWRWSASDLLSNTQRATVADFLFPFNHPPTIRCSAKWQLGSLIHRVPRPIHRASGS